MLEDSLLIRVSFSLQNKASMKLKRSDGKYEGRHANVDVWLSAWLILFNVSPEDVFLIVEIKFIAPHLISSRRKEKMEDKVSLNKGLAKLMI